MDTKTVTDGARPAAMGAIARLRSRSKVAGTYPVYLDREWVDAVNAAKERLTNAQARKDNDVEIRAFHELHDLEAQREDKVLDFQFRSLGPAEYEELLAKHRATPEQVERHKASGSMFPPQWDTETFPLALIGLSLLAPKLDGDELAALYAGDAFAELPEEKLGPSLLSVIEFKEMFNVALTASTMAPKLED